MHVGQQCTAVLKRSLLKFNRNKHNRSVRGDAERAPGSCRKQTPARPQAPLPRPRPLLLPSLSLLTTCQELLNDIFASLLPPTCPLHSSAPPHPPPPFRLETNRVDVKRTSNYFLPEQSQNIKHVLKSCTVPWRNFMIWLLPRARAAPWPEER